MGIFWTMIEVGFNTQPPEGGCLIFQSLHLNYQRFNTQPPEGGCIIKRHIKYKVKGFNTQPPEGGCQIVISVEL